MGNSNTTAGRRPLMAGVALIATSLGSAGCDREPSVVDEVEHAASDLANDLGIVDEPTEVRVYFALGSAALSPEVRSKLDAVAERYASMNDPGIMLAGYSDTIGNAATNLALSRQRAIAVQDYLQRQGIPSASFETEVSGERDPRVATGDDVRERANRRVRISINEH